jgi:hypothetical protein
MPAFAGPADVCALGHLILALIRGSYLFNDGELSTRAQLAIMEDIFGPMPLSLVEAAALHNKELFAAGRTHLRSLTVIERQQCKDRNNWKQAPAHQLLNLVYSSIYHF